MDKVTQDNFERLLSQFLNMKVLHPDKTYVITLSLPKDCKEVDTIVNKVSILFKQLGIKNIAVLPWQTQMFEIAKD